ncbi:unnamed protein product, partial [Sphacelaria rigidula]
RRHRAAAKSIQAAFRFFLARQTLGKRRAAAFLLRRRRAARTLQCWARGIFARRRLRVTGNRRRVIQYMAATMIQGQWRPIERERLFRSAAAVQRIIRGYVIREKVGRQLIRVRSLMRTRAVYTLQKFVRRAQARRRVRGFRKRRRRGLCTRAALHLQRVCRGFLGRRKAAKTRKAVSLDIWRAAREGKWNAARVDALYYGQGLGGVIFDSQNGRDPEGNSLLSAVAGGTSTVSLVRAILKWGVDINAINCR